MPRAATQALAFALMLTDSIVLRRAGVNLSAQSCYVDWSEEGRDAALTSGAAGVALPQDSGKGGRAEGVAVWWKGDANVARGDLFAHGGSQFRIEFVSGAANHVTGGAVMKVAWAEKNQ